MVRVRDYKKRKRNFRTQSNVQYQKMPLSPSTALCAVLLLVLAARLARTEAAGKLK